MPQSKTSKPKLCALIAGASRHSCWFAALAQSLTLNRIPVYEPAKSAWIFPKLQQGKYHGTVLGSYIKALQPAQADGGLVKYKDVAVPGLPVGVSAASIRPGVCNTLVSNMPVEIAIANTGHTLTSVSVNFEYVDSALAVCIPGALVLAGWPAPPWGQLSPGVVPASLAL